MNKYSVDIGFTNVCDFNCDVCINKYLKKDEMDFEKMKKVLFFLKNNSQYFDIISFNGIGNFFLYSKYDAVLDFLIENEKYFYKKIYFATKFKIIDLKYLLKIYRLNILCNISIGLYNFDILKKLKGFNLKNLLEKIKKYNKILPLSIEIAGVYHKKEFFYWNNIGKILGIDIVFERLYNWGGDINYDEKEFIIEGSGKHCYNNFFIYIDVYGDIYPCVQFSNKGKQYSIGNIDDFYLLNIIEIESKMKEKFSGKFCKTCSLRKDCDIYNAYLIKKG